MKTKSMVRVLSDIEISNIHKLSLRILEEIGVKMTHEEGLRLLKDGGCIVDKKDKRVRIPESLSNEIIRKNVEKKPKLFHRDSPKCLELENELFFSLRKQISEAYE